MFSVSLFNSFNFFNFLFNSQKIEDCSEVGGFVNFFCMFPVHQMVTWILSFLTPSAASLQKPRLKGGCDKSRPQKNLKTKFAEMFWYVFAFGSCASFLSPVFVCFFMAHVGVFNGVLSEFFCRKES